ncbi:MAG: sulfite exporter TauE/SafE family protein, partial [Bacteroidetes bacterium]|nr:sulfite exporter TauE/SafE family protein [Bacteroidota bacterium]
MDMLIIAIVSVFAAGLTFFSGFGLGTILLPVFSIFFPVTTAIAATALVHFANNVFKFGLLYKYIHFKTAAYFGIPAILAAAIGGYVLVQLGKPIPFHTYTLGNHEFSMSSLKVTIGCLLIFFAFFELNERLKNYTFPPKYLWVGGILSGFFGGLSGHQGAFRSAFLAKSGLDKKQFVATSNAIALVIDVSRLIV